jgi:hypothetical protein
MNNEWMSPDETFWDFPEDGFVMGPEFLAKEKLLEGLTGFARQQVSESLADPDEAFCPGIKEVMQKLGDSMHDMLWINIIEWLLFDKAVADDGRTNSDLYWSRNKLFLPGLQKKVLAMMREAEMGIFEVREVHPGRGFDLKRLGDGRLFQVVEMKASRSISRWTILACRLWVLDGVHRLSGSMYWFEPQQLPHLLEEMDSLAPGGNDQRPSRERFSPEMCRLWIDPFLHPREVRYCNKDGDPLKFCQAIFAVADREALRQALLAQRSIMIRDDGKGILGWYAKKKDVSGGRTIMGTFQLLEGEMKFEANSEARFLRGMEFLRAQMGGMIRLKEEKRVPLEEMLDRSQDKPREPLEISKEEQEKVLAPILRKHYEKWPTTRLPALNGRTPRQAVRSKEGRQAVARLLKDFEMHAERMRLKGEPSCDVSFLWQELGLDPAEF